MGPISAVGVCNAPVRERHIRIPRGSSCRNLQCCCRCHEGIQEVKSISQKCLPSCCSLCPSSSTGQFPHATSLLNAELPTHLHSLFDPQVKHGDHHRRGADHGEALGASIKQTLHQRTLRRQAGVGRKEYHRKDADGQVIKTWSQRALQCSRVMQVFRSMSITERVLRDEKSAPFLQRKHFVLAKSGFTTAAHSIKGEATAEPEADSIFKKISVAAKEALECA